MQLRLILLLIFSIPFIYPAVAQKGLPAKDETNASVNTSFPQIKDFKQGMQKTLVVAPGFVVTVAASGLGKPRMMVISENSIYFSRRDQGDILLLTDIDNDGIFDELKTIAVQFKGVHGITIHDGYLYACSNTQVKRAKLKSDGGIEKFDLLIKDLPDGGQHGNRTIAFGPDGKLYITVGSDCNDCNETNKEHATVLRCNPDGTDRKIFARGLRNTIGIDWHPVTKELYGADNGADWRGDDWPPEELNKIIEGGDYGWPLVYGNQEVDKTREDPTGTTKAEYAKTTQPAALVFPAHSAPINLVFLAKASGFPDDIKDDALITLHGSWNRKQPDGYKVQRIIFENGKPVKSEDFLSGFLSTDGKSRFGRPAGLAVSEKGYVYVSDDAGGVIYKISKK